MRVNRSILNNSGNLIDHVKIALKWFESHPSIISIKENVSVVSKFSFLKVNTFYIKSEIKSLKPNKASIFLNIPAKHLKPVIEIMGLPLIQIWNINIIDNKKFPTKLKYTDTTPIFKTLECILVDNYRPVSILPVVSLKE